MQFDFDDFGRSGTAPMGSKLKTNSLGVQGSTKHRPKTRDVVDSIGECNLALQMDRLTRLSLQDSRDETSYIDGIADHSATKDIIRLNLNPKEAVNTDRKMRTSERVNNWTDDCKVIDKVLQTFSDNNGNNNDNSNNHNQSSRQLPTNVITKSNNINSKIHTSPIRSKTPSSLAYTTNPSTIYNHQSRPVSHQSTIKPSNSINATAVLAPYLEGNFSSNTNSLLKSKRKIQINKKKESQKSSNAMLEYTSNVNRDRPSTTSNVGTSIVKSNDNQRKVYQPPDTATQVPIERPQSRKLYLGSDKQAGNTARPMRSASSVVVGATNTDDHPNLRRLSSFNGFVNTSWQDDTFPHRPPSRQSSAFPIDLADAKSVDNEISDDDSIVEICSDDDSIVEEIDAKVSKLTSNNNNSSSRRGSQSALNTINDPVRDGFLDLDSNHVPFRIEINYSAVNAVPSAGGKSGITKSSSSTRRPSNSSPTSIFNYSNQFNEYNSPQLERSKSLRSTTSDKKSPPSVFNRTSPINHNEDTVVSDSDEDIEILSDTCDHITSELTLETSLGEDFLNLFAPSSPSRW